MDEKKLLKQAQANAKEAYESEYGAGSWDEADKYEREDWVYTEYERLSKVKENVNMARERDSKGRFVKAVNTVKKENDNMKKRTVENRMETLANAGIDTSKFFQMNLIIPLDASVNLAINGKTVQLTGNVQKDIAISEAIDCSGLKYGDVAFDEVAQQISADGYVNNPKLFRRWICSQVLRMMNWESWNGTESGYDAYVRNCYDYTQTFKMTIDELHRIAAMLKDGDEMGNEALYFFNKDVVVAMMEDYLRKLKKYIKHTRQSRTRKCHGKEYVRLATYGDVYVTDLQTNVYSKIEFYIDAVKRATSLTQTEKVLRDFMDNAYNKLPYGTALSSVWKDAFKGNGAYFTLQNLVRFHCDVNGNPFVIENYKTGELLKRTEADKYLKSLLDEYNGCGWKFMEVLKRALEINDFDFWKSVEMNRAR